MGGKGKTEKMSATLRKQKIALEKGFGAWKNESHPDLATPEDSIAYVRAVRQAGKERLTRLEGARAR